MNELPHDELLGAYLDGELTAAERARAEQLLADSAESRQLLDELRALRSGLQSLPQFRLEEDFAERVLQQAERSMLLSGEAVVADASQAAPMQREALDWRDSRWMRPLSWAGLAIAVALLVMMFAPDESPRQDDGARVAVAPERRSDEDGAVSAPAMQAAPDEPASQPLAAPEAAPAMRPAEPAPAPLAGRAAEFAAPPAEEVMSDADDDLLIVELHVRPTATREGVLDRVLSEQQIEVQEPLVVGRGERDAVDAEEDVAPAADAELVYVEATAAQLEATLADLAANREAFVTVSLDPAPGAPLQNAWSETYSRGQIEREPIALPQAAEPNLARGADARQHGPATLDRRMSKGGALEAYAPEGRDDAFRAQVRQWVETQAPPAEGSRAQRLAVPDDVREQVFQRSRRGEPARAAATADEAAEGTAMTGKSRALFVIRVVEEEPADPAAETAPR